MKSFNMFSKHMLKLKIIFEQAHESTIVLEELFHCCWQNILCFFDKIIVKYKLEYFYAFHDSEKTLWYFLLACPI